MYNLIGNDTKLKTQYSISLGGCNQIVSPKVIYFFLEETRFVVPMLYLKNKNPLISMKTGDLRVGLLGLEPRTTGPKPAVLPITP